MAEVFKDQLDTIHQEIRQAEDTTRQPHERCPMLLQQLNDKQASTRALPSEILSLIFEHARPQDASFCSSDICCSPRRRKVAFSVLILGHISSHWRRVAWSTPQLWTKMGACVRKKNAESIPRILGLYLQNVRGLPFSLKLKIVASRSKQAFLTAIQPIKSLLDNDEYSKKIRALHLGGVPPEWASSIFSNFSRLEYLEIDGPFDSPLILEDIPLLRHLSLLEVCGDISVSGSSITKLDLRGVPINTSAMLLTQCPNLTSFYSGDPLNETAVFHPPTSTIILRHLQELYWVYHDSPSCLAALAAVKVPALQTLTWSDRCRSAPQVEPSIRALLTDRLDTLLTLELAIHVWTLPLIEHVFNRCHYVQNLHMRVHDKGCLDRVLDVLYRGLDGSRASYLPSLVSLTISTNYGLNVYDNSAGDEPYVHYSRRILALCKARWTGPNQEPAFRLRVNSLKIKWPEDVETELCEMVRNGFQLDIFELGARSWWLPQMSS